MYGPNNGENSYINKYNINKYKIKSELYIINIIIYWFIM